MLAAFVSSADLSRQGDVANLLDAEPHRRWAIEMFLSRSTGGCPPAWARGSVVVMHFTEYDTRLAAYAVIVNQADEILLTWYNGEGLVTPKWTLPGGGVEFDESVADAVVREVYEETGYHVELGRLLAVPHFTLTRSNERARPFRSQRFLYAAAIVGGELGTTEVGGTTDLARWIPMEEVQYLEADRADIVDLAVELAGSLADSRRIWDDSAPR